MTKQDNMNKVTIITRGGLGNLVVTHAKLVEHGRKPYAQYKSAPFVKYIKKGARTIVGNVFAYDPYLVILEGWQDIKSQEIFGEAKLSSTGALVSQGKFSSCSDGWQKEFEAANEFKGVIADYRGVNSHEVL